MVCRESVQEGLLASGDGVRAGDASVISADIEAGLGLIHVVDRVLLPAA